jgi:hypothetical protein
MITLNSVLDSARDLLRGEPARVIGYGSAVVIYIAANLLDVLPDVTFDQAIAQGAAVIVTVATVIETIRSLVYSPNSVAAIAAEAIDAEAV